MFAFFVVIHVLICLAMILVVLLQSGRGGGLAGAFGGGGGQAFFGGRGAATFLSKATSWLAVAFMAMSILLAVLSSRGNAPGDSLLQRRARDQAGEVNLPPSTTTLDPATALDSLPLEAPAVQAAPAEDKKNEGGGSTP